MNIKITADSTCDLSEALLRQWNISLIPMHILMGEESYLDGVTIHPADVFAHAQNGGKMPKSAAPNLVEYTDFLAPFARDYDAVIHINVGSKFSSCFQNARLAAQEFGNVYVVDSENICTGQGYLVLQAAKWAADGLPPKNISMRLQGLAKRVELSFVLNQLDYMAKSGRCSGVLAFGANILGITGRSGSGKSTFLRLLMRFWDVSSGTIRFGERDIRAVNTAALRAQESLVTQETELFDDTIENNIRIARRDATRAEVEAACRKAALDGFINSLPKGYDTPVGELGGALSGGERQRIGVARAFLHDAPFLLLDEPTSNLDSLNEGIILKAVRDECREKTVLLVSHRRSTMAVADLSFSVESGRLS